MRAISAVVVGLVIVFASAGVAAAKSSPQSQAKANAEGFIQSYLPSAPGQPGICDTKTQEGLFDKNKMYLASCSSADGSLQIFAFANASKGSLSENSPYVAAQLNNFCKGQGAAFATGVKGKFVLIFAGTGDASMFGTAASVAKGLDGMLADQIKNAAGHVSVQLC